MEALKPNWLAHESTIFAEKYNRLISVIPVCMNAYKFTLCNQENIYVSTHQTCYVDGSESK